MADAMTDDDVVADDPPPVRKSRRRWLGVAAFLLLAVTGALGLAAWWFDSDQGHRFITRQIAALSFENGMLIDVGAIDGSIYGDMQLRDVTLSDPKGVFVTAPVIAIAWKPLALVRRHVDISSLTAPSIRLLRMPEFAEVPLSDEPILPDIDIDIDRFEVRRLSIAPAITGQAHALTISGKVEIADRRALVHADVHALEGLAVAGGDRLSLRLDATPDANRFDLSLSLDAPADGLVAALSGRAAPLALTLRGKGDWEKWDGRLTATSDGANAAALRLTARSGSFRVNGNLYPALLAAESSVAAILKPVTAIDLTARLADRRADLDGSIGNDNFSLAVDGLIDFAASRYERLALDLRLARPSAIAAKLSGSGVIASVLLDGAIATPDIDYAVNAARLDFDGTVIEGLVVTGRGRVDPDQIMLPVSARARRISGLNAAAGELLNNVRVNGNVAIQGSRVLSDNLRIRSDRIDATAIVVADTATGLYTGALKGRVNDYQVAGFGTFNVEADLDLKTRASRFAIAGTVRARSTRLASAGVADFLGGNGVLSAYVNYGGDGVVRVSRVAVAAPAFRMTGGSGHFIPGGPIAFAGRGLSDRYGPLSVTLSGTTDRPVARIDATRPGLGIGLTGLNIVVQGKGDRYNAVFTGLSDYGPVTGDIDIMAGQGPLTLDIKRASVAGLGLSGRIRQSAAGPFTGQLVATGNGIAGRVELSSASGRYQRAVIALTAADAVFPGAAMLSVGRAIVTADVILYDRPQMVADVQIADTRWRSLEIGVGRAKIDYRAGEGTARFVVEGRNRFPFRVAGNATMTPQLWRIALAGRVNGIDFATVSPARIIPVGRSGYRLDPTTIDLSRGRIALAGEYGNGLTVRSRLDNVDLALLNPLSPGLGLGGSATGTVDFAQQGSGFPTADARLRVTDFTRTSLASVSQPVDISLVGQLRADNTSLRAVVRRGETVIGRMRADLVPLSPGAGDWTARVLGAPLRGGIRYNGPASTLFSLAALPDQSLSGPIGVAADFSGSVGNPALSGAVRANNLVYENDRYGTRLTRMRVRGQFVNDRLTVTELSARAGQGTITGSGFVSLSSDQGFPIQLDLDLDRARVASGNDLTATATGRIAVINGGGLPPTIRGTLTLPETRYRIVRESVVAVATLTGVRRKLSATRPRITGDPDPVSGVPSDWRLEIDLTANDQLFVSGMGLNSEWSADLKIRGTTGAPLIGGRIELVRGTLGFAGRSFELTSGRLSFPLNDTTNPTLAIVATGEADGVTINVAIAGTAGDPQITFSSTPALPQDEIMARILFGSSIGQLSAIQAVQLASSLNGLRGGRGGLNPLGVLQSATGIDRLRILGADEKTGRGTSVGVGQYISNDVYVEIVTDARGYTATQIEISLTPALSVLSEVGSFGGSNVSLRYRKDY